MKRVLKILLSPILAVNLLVAIGLICCAYSPLLPAEKIPLLSLAGLAFPFVLAANVCFLVLWIFVYRRYTLVSFITFLLCIPQIRAFLPINIGQQNTPKESIKVLSYNVLSQNIN